MLMSSFVKHLLLVRSVLSYSTSSKGNFEAWKTHASYEELLFVQHRASAGKVNVSTSTQASSPQISDSEVSCSASSEYPGLPCSNLLTDSNDAFYGESGSYTWAANMETCVGTWVELTLSSEHTISQAAFRQRYRQQDQAATMRIDLKQSDGNVLYTQNVNFANVNVMNPPEETFDLQETSGVTSVRFTFTSAGPTSNCPGYLGGKRAKLFGFAATESPTASPTDVSGGHGDPHIVNIRGEKFDIWRLGTVELLRLHDKDSHHPEFRFTANVSSEHETQSVSLCDARYMTSMRFSGSWFGNQEVYIRLVDGEMRVHVGDKSLIPLEQVLIGKNLGVSRPSESLVTVSVGDATINVMPDNAVFKPHFYLNTEVRNLASLGLKIGGILGNDDHTKVAQKPASCESQFVAVRHKVYGSSASATLHD